MSANEELMSLTADIVSAYVTRNAVPAGDLPGLIGQVHSSISALAAGRPAVVEAPVPAVPVKKSITPDYIICLDDGKKFKSLKRHLGSAYDMTPDQYRQKWNLPPDYPMVAPNYAAARSALAKASGLGQKPGPRKRRGAGKG
jgi:predicted transcriptional regulator